MRQGESLVGRYELLLRIGKGAMGQVWLAQDTLLGRRVAIKHLLEVEDELTAGLVQRAMREARLAAQLNHPNAVQIHDVIMDQGIPHVVMEYVEGETLASRIKAEGRLAPHVLRPILRNVASALAAAHDLGIVHRDVKPANILISGSGVAKLADFGIARAGHDAALTGTGIVIGTLAFMAPEVANGQPATPASDIWSLGATAYSATEGQAPFSGENSAQMLIRKVTQTAPPALAAGELTQLLHAMMASDAAARPLARDIVRMLEVGGTPALSAAGPTRVRTPDLTSQRQPDSVAATRRRDPHANAATDLRGGGPDNFGGTTRNQPANEGRSRTPLLVAILVMVLAAIGGVTAVALSTQSSDTHAAQTTRPQSSNATTPTPSTTTSTSEPQTTTPETSSAATSKAVTATVEYSAPGGISVALPPGWRRDASAGIANIADYLAPGAAGRSTGSYVRLGIGNPAPSADLSAEARSAKSFLDTSGLYSGVRVLSTRYLTFLGSAAVDIEFVARNQNGVPRHVRERLWHMSGVTLELQLNAATDEWARLESVFGDLVATCRVR
jgi:eukaryotic-like serine/threonine-protein kinase